MNANKTIVSALLILTISDRQTSARRIASAGDEERKVFKSKCGTKEQVSERAGKCMGPVFDLVEGRGYEPAKTDDDIMKHCTTFQNVERCVRDLGKECLDGLHKAAVGSLATSTRRFRGKECKTVESRAKYFEPLKCALARSDYTRRMYVNLTNLAHSIEVLPIAPEERMVKVCCLLNVLEAETTQLFKNSCPDSVPVILTLQHAITDDARNTLCRNPKCAGVLDKVPKKKAVNVTNLIVPIMGIMLDL